MADPDSLAGFKRGEGEEQREEEGRGEPNNSGKLLTPV